ncbi:unnamed protein product [Mytilus edulis]|uniref:Uncharacterized protein n=1 Tax=Mytilus edulis TaxID=6550 RepID=A0A8S3RY38_MYTED|nr:unnamed protein product [Mytilus edulis]
MTARKFYGSHFHSLVIHAPETYRLLCLRSVVPEEEERTFGDIRSISKNTSNRQPEYVVDNAVMRFNAQQESHSVIESIQKQESVISQQAKFLDKKTNTTIKITDIIKNPYQFQCHLQRIPDFLLCGKGVWWSLSASSVIFHDTVDQDLNSNNPPLHNLRSTTLVEEQSYLLECWDEVLKRVEKSTIKIPVHKIKCYRNDQLVKTLYTDIFEDESSDEENTEIIHPIASAVIHNEEETINRTRSHETDESSEESESNDGMNTDTSSELENLEMLPIATPIIDDDCKDSEPIQPEDADLELPQICQSVNPTPTIDDKCGVPVVAKVNLYPNPENDETKKLYKSYMKESMELSAGNAQISHDNVKDCTKLPSDLQSNCQRPTQVLSNARQVSNYAAKKYTKLPITKPSECKGQARGAVKRKLNFGKERDDEEKENHQWKMVTSNTASSEIEKKSTRQKESSNNKTQKKMTNMTEMEKLELLFGETEEMRQLKADSDRIQRCPGVSSFQTALDCSHAKIQTKVVQKQSKLQGLLSKSPENKRLLFEKTLAELLLTSWNCYYEGSGKRI